MMKKIFIFAAFAGFLALSLPVMSQIAEKPLTPAEKKLRSDKEQDTKAADWVKSLNLNDVTKEARVAQLISTHLKTTRDWNNDHPFSTVPAGINPYTGTKLSDQDRQIIAQSAMPKSIHDDLIAGLRNELTEEQVEAILDKYTIGKVAFTLQGYKSIVTDLTKEEETKIVGFLKQAREQAIDYKSMKQISAIFEIYKNKCEQYLNNNGRNWRQLFKAYVDKVKAEKAAAAQKEQPAKK